ncbi:MAG: hypothetical protein DRP78_00410 [Candidatus Omnitrophota bacterium]|nr:MAG: hypothetical protein DRP78_00410 [Candidatus Omnitrophota bacterium]
MRRVIFVLVLLSMFFYQGNVFAKDDISALNREFDEKREQIEALSIADDVAADKDINVDLDSLLDSGYSYWADLKFDQASQKFKAARRLEPGNLKIRDLIEKVALAKVKYAQKQVAFETKLDSEYKVLVMDDALLAKDPTKETTTYKISKPAQNKLRQDAEKKIVSIDFSEAQASTILGYLSEQSGINIIFDEAAVSTAGTLSIHLKDVTLVQALESVLRTKGLAYRFEKDFIWVSSPENIAAEQMITRVYHLSQGLAAFTTFTTFDTVTIDGLSPDGKVVVKSAIKNKKKQAGTEGGENYEGVKIGGPSGVAGKITTTIKDVLEEMVTWPKGSSIFLDQRTSTLIVHNTPSNLALIEQCIEALDVIPPQVMIEARFVEVGADDLFALGLELSAEISGQGASEPHTFPFNKNQDTKYTDAFPFANPLDFTFGRLDFSQFKTVLSAIEQDTDSNVLSSPKITTISGQEAVIKIVKEYRYPTKYQIQTYESGSNDNKTMYYATVPDEFKTRDIGIILKVTPNVGANHKTINLTLVPEVSEFDIEKDMYNYGTEDHPYLQPFFSARSTTASIVVGNSDTVVMGGLMREVVEHSVSRVPVLGNLPLIGKLFSHKRDTKKKRNLLIFITAHLIAPDGKTFEN